MTPTTPGRWSDLGPRVGSATALAVVGLFEIWVGGRFFHIFVGLVAAIMLWELVRMLAPARRKSAWISGIIGGAVLVLVAERLGTAQVMTQLALLAILAVGIGLGTGERRRMGIPYAAIILFGGLCLMMVRDNLGFAWMIWLLFIVMASDVAGYFAGKALGGPKFWPAISPKKTWSGTVAGWIAAGAVGLVFGWGSGSLGLIVTLSLILAFAAQLGDIAESAIKRRTGVKDSSALIPGHGGVLDRFDGLLGAACVLLAIALITGLPEGLV